MSVPPHFANEKTQHASGGRQHQALGDQLTTEAGTTRSNGKGHAQFALPPRGARQDPPNADAAPVAAACTRNSTLSKYRCTGDFNDAGTDAITSPNVRL